MKLKSTMLRVLCRIVFVVFGIGAGINPAQAQSSQLIWKLVFSDEFDGTSIDASKWQVANFMSIRNNEKNYYTTEDAYLNGSGSLVLRQQKRNYSGAAYTSGQLISKNYVMGGTSQGKWKIEVRARPTKGQGLHNAYWMFHDDVNPPNWNSAVWPPELDVMEILGNADEINQAHMNFYWGNESNPGNFECIKTGSTPWTSDYHIFSLEVSPTTITWYIDAQQACNYSTTANMTQLANTTMKILLDVSIGGDWPGMPDNTTVWPSYSYVDYVRLYHEEQGVNVNESMVFSARHAAGNPAALACFNILGQQLSVNRAQAARHLRFFRPQNAQGTTAVTVIAPGVK
jgi:beta-glucanase (GH16 family)